MTSSIEHSILARHYERTALVSASAERVFAHVDDPTRVSSHMSRRSWRMGGGRMETVLDQGRGQTVGSHIRLRGRVLGVALSVDEVVTERTPPIRKVWETAGSPSLLVIGPYRMGFDVTPRDGSSMLRVFIAYALPKDWPSRWLGWLFGRYYARWCTKRMVDDAVEHFAGHQA